MGGIDAMMLASALPDSISASPREICVLLTGALVLCALAIATAGLISSFPSSQTREYLWPGGHPKAMPRTNGTHG